MYCFIQNVTCSLGRGEGEGQPARRGEEEGHEGGDLGGVAGRHRLGTRDYL